jgi:hypothetical protein
MVARGRGQDAALPVPKPTGSRRQRWLSLLSAVAVCSLSVGAAVAQEVASPLSAAAITPSAVTDINPNSLTSGTLFGGRTVNFAVDPNNTNNVFAATEFGGLWKSTAWEKEALLTSQRVQPTKTGCRGTISSRAGCTCGESPASIVTTCTEPKTTPIY